MIIPEQYMIGIQRTNGNWNYAREAQNGEIQFFPLNEWHRDVVWFHTESEAIEWWNKRKDSVAFFPDFDKYFKRETLCIRKRILVLFEENLSKMSF